MYDRYYSFFDLILSDLSAKRDRIIQKKEWYSKKIKKKDISLKVLSKKKAK